MRPNQTVLSQLTKRFVRLIHSGSGRTAADLSVIRLSKDESCFFVEHPDVEHQYKYTKPMPTARKGDEESILKVDSRHMITKSPNLEQLQSLTYTPARYWKQYPGREKRERYRRYFNDNVDRPGLTS